MDEPFWELGNLSSSPEGLQPVQHALPEPTDYLHTFEASGQNKRIGTAKLGTLALVLFGVGAFLFNTSAEALFINGLALGCFGILCSLLILFAGLGTTRELLSLHSSHRVQVVVNKNSIRADAVMSVINHIWNVREYPLSQAREVEHSYSIQTTETGARIRTDEYLIKGFTQSSKQWILDYTVSVKDLSEEEGLRISQQLANAIGVPFNNLGQKKRVMWQDEHRNKEQELD
ncbi:MAG: hypothetical protein VXW14_01355 [Candidatus Thermoplasmatota archaeon]|nr:hypothetical protein [Candidatus Thermoplasmatota archaeon]MEC7253909.1 hypothetical protein [Candidatus Thermoplasmatota archaeon]